MCEEEKSYAINDKRGQVKDNKTTDVNSVKSNEGTAQSSAKQPTINFTSFLLSISTSALVQMGLVPDPVTNKTQKNMVLAKQQVDIIEMLGEKSKGNLDESEQKLLDQVLYELRLRYVEVKNNTSA